MTYTVSGGALNSAQPQPVLYCAVFWWYINLKTRKHGYIFIYVQGQYSEKSIGCRYCYSLHQWTSAGGSLILEAANCSCTRTLHATEKRNVVVKDCVIWWVLHIFNYFWSVLQNTYLTVYLFIEVIVYCLMHIIYAFFRLSVLCSIAESDVCMNVLPAKPMEGMRCHLAGTLVWSQLTLC